MAVAADGGGSDGFPRKGNFDSGDIDQGGGNVSGGPHAQSALEQGGRLALNALPGGTIISGIMSFGGGAADEVAKALKPTDPNLLIDQASKWGHVSTKAYGYSEQVRTVMSKLANWHGDDADKAREVLQGLYATYNTVGNTSSHMNTTLGNMGATLKWARDNYGDGGGFGDGLEDTFTGGGASDEAANAYQTLLTNFNENMGNMPTSVPSEVKPGAGAPAAPYSPPSNQPTAPVSGAPHAGGAGGAPHVGNPVAPHIPKPPNPIDDPPPRQNEPNPTPGPGDTPTFDTPTTGGGSTYDPSSIGGTGSGYTGGGGGGLGSPGLDTSGSLAGYDPSAAGGGAGAGSLGGAPGGASGAGLPGGGVPGGGAGLGAGAGGGIGSGGGGGVVGGGAGGRGSMMPMHGGQNNDDDERERSTWLNEEEDVWGAEENLPGVIH